MVKKGKGTKGQTMIYKAQHTNDWANLAIHSFGVGISALDNVLIISIF